MNPRLRRLQADYEQIREIYSGHPHVTVEAIGAVMPPESYRITYRVKGLQLIGDQPEVRDSHGVELMLPKRYPADKPYAVPLEPVFHPNIKEYYCIADYWAAGTTLVDVIAKIGDMIQWKIYNPASPLDAVAARWASENESNGVFPLGNIDLSVADFDVQVRDTESDADDGSSEKSPAVDAELPEVPTADSPVETGSDVDDFEIILKA